MHVYSQVQIKISMVVAYKPEPRYPVKMLTGTGLEEGELLMVAMNENGYSYKR